jgi:hypothetical protein
MDEEIKQKILTLLDQHRIMTVAALRPDGWPQVTTVGYANEGLTLYFLCRLDRQSAVADSDRGLARKGTWTPAILKVAFFAVAIRFFDLEQLPRPSQIRPGLTNDGQ